MPRIFNESGFLPALFFTITQKFSSRTTYIKGVVNSLKRKINVSNDAPAVDRKEIAKILASYVTGGDPSGYLARLAEKQQKEIESKKTE